MLNPGLSADEYRAYLSGLMLSHPVRCRIQVLDADETHVGDLLDHGIGSNIVTAAVTVDSSQPVSRRLDLTVIDRRGILHFDSDTPIDGRVGPELFLRAIRSDYIAALDDFIDVPVFTGPITSFQRTGAQVVVEALGKESLYLQPCIVWDPLVLNKGQRVTDAIQEVLHRQGETKFAISRRPHQLHHDVNVHKGAEAWTIIHKLAQSVNRQVFFDGEGRCKLRLAPNHPVLTFYQGTEETGNPEKLPTVVSPPPVTFDYTQIRNAVEITGGTPKGANNPVKWTAVAQRSHPFSPQRLARNGKPRYLVEQIQNQHIQRVGHAQELAEHTLERDLVAPRTATFDSLTLTVLEEEDMVRIVARGDFELDQNLVLQQFTMPLTSTALMSIGDVRRQPSGKLKVQIHKDRSHHSKRSHHQGSGGGHKGSGHGGHQ